MLICPHCQSENPDTHKFCQKCGGSLTEKACPVCTALIPFEAEYCSHCGTATGTVWKALLIPIEFSLSKTNPPEVGTPTPSSGSLTCAEQEIYTLLQGKSLDSQGRYQLIEAPSVASDVAEVRVLDCQPLQLSILEDCYHQTASGSLAEMEQALTIPAAARPYLELQERYPALPLPQVHDAWAQDGLNIVLLEDRTTLPVLFSFWQNEQVPLLQILHWLYEMIELWAVLQPYQCCQSLLVLDNLRVDEDYLLCLQRLHSDLPNHSLDLRDLGRFWQMLFQQSQRTQRRDLSQLCSDLESGIVNSLNQLRSRIEAIAILLQSNSDIMASSSNSPEPANPFAMDDSTLNETPIFNEPPDSAEPVTAPLPQGITPSEMMSAAMGVPLMTQVDSAEWSEGFEDQVPTTPNEQVSEGDDSPTVVLPMQLVSLEDAGVTDIGRQRDHNEDCFSIQSEIKKLEGFKGRSLQAKGLYILCDGMGGHAGGEIASALAVETLQSYFAEHWQDQLPSYESIQSAIQRANQAIYDLNQQNARSGNGRMGTTLVLVLIQGTEAAIAHVGDSRLYRFSRRRGVEPLTVDHEVGQREIQRGVEPAIAYARPDAYQLTQALGPRDEHFVSPDIQFLELNEDMLLLLCSDGLTDNHLLEIHWQNHLEPLLSTQNNLEQGVHQLIALANQHNGHDNITAVAIRVKVRPKIEQLARR